jgi:hypothetical protein
MSVPTSFFLFKRSNGVYYVCYEIDGRRCGKSARTTRRSEAHKTLTN